MDREQAIKKMVSIMSPDPVWKAITFNDCANKLFDAGYHQEGLQNKPNIPKDTIAWLMRRLNATDMAELMLSISTGQPVLSGDEIRITTRELELMQNPKEQKRADRADTERESYYRQNPNM